MERPGIYFFHIPKTAGMSVWRFLEQAFPSYEVCPWWLWDQLITVPRAQLSRWDLFRGHFLSHLEPYLGRELKTFTMLRDPVARTISHYYHARRAPEHPAYKYARQLPLREFCVHPATRHMVENYQSSYLAKSALTPMVVAQELSPEALAQFELQERMQFPDPLDPSTLFERAAERLTSFAAVGFVEDFTNSLARVSRSLGAIGSQAVEPQNVNPDPDRLEAASLDEATLTLIRELTEVDRRVYQFAKSRA